MQVCNYFFVFTTWAINSPTSQTNVLPTKAYPLIVTIPRRIGAIFTNLKTSRHYRLIGKMSHEERLVHGYILATDHKIIRHFVNLIH